MNNVEDNNKGCRIMVGWNANLLKVWLISQSRQYMFILVETRDGKSKFYCTMIYASNSGMERRRLWKDLGIQKIITNGVPWVIMGDFNVTLKVSEHSNGGAFPTNEMTEFQECIDNIEVLDLHSEGFHFTWTKSLRSPKCSTLKKLDRIMVNEDFVDIFQLAHGVFLPYLISDHTPIVVRIPNGVQKRKGAFRFSNFITEKKEFLPTVRSVWQMRFEGHTMYRVVQKMKHLKRKLKKLSWMNGNVFERAEQLRSKVKESQTEVDRFPHDEGIKMKCWSVLKEYQEATKEEYSLLCQKAKVEWLKEGDRNTAYFHKAIKERVHRGRIMTIRNEEGIRFENEEVATQIVKHFEDFLGKCRGVQKLEGRQDIFINKISTEEAVRMVRNVSDSEIKNAMFEIEDSKAPGPDGYTARFYKSAWNIILTSRIKGVLGTLVGENQSAFIEGRQITDNILLSQELFKGYNRKQNIKKVSFKIDIQKAYDTISWEFLRETLEMFGFHKTMVSWIMTCVTSTKFSINVNGERVGYFKGGRGLRQGDPISPYLFTLVMEVLNLLIQKNIKESKVFKYHFGCKSLKITHLCFADDLLMFCHGDPGSVKVLKQSLDEFSGYSGLLPNMQKSSIFFGGLSDVEQQNIINIIPFSIGKLPASVFLLPKQVIYEINKLLKGFLWCQGELTKGKAKVSWNKICKPKDQGGLGLKNLSVWNEVWTADWSTEFVELGQLQVPTLNDRIKDTTVWIFGNGCEKEFKIMYYIWQERNNRIFKNEKRDKDAIFSIIKDIIVIKLIGLRVKESKTVHEVEEKWKLKLQKEE
ncbi:RNA-directed DNA polymerase, eukaryota, reverse transcriptase zinc-binding domain protein [Tanacetum coccineum]|uniref:RNA-directed DNA polymerase, eukaryota, reverse transcriptase zinc-binding domain protein n=1 Tax=Tanacetum coccineum TaxID=301880 RepID=A0ABQ5AHI2_9ASTR